MLFPNTIRVSLRPASVPLRIDVSGTNCTEWYSIVMNGISKYHSGIIETGKFTIEDVSCTEWYFQIPLIRVALRPASVPLRTSRVLNGTQ